MVISIESAVAPRMRSLAPSSSSPSAGQRAAGASDERCRKQQRTDRQQETRQRVVLVPPRLREERRERERESCKGGGGGVERATPRLRRGCWRVLHRSFFSRRDRRSPHLAINLHLEHYCALYLERRKAARALGHRSICVQHSTGWQSSRYRNIGDILSPG